MSKERKLEIKAGLRDGNARYKLVKPANLKSSVWENFDLIEFDGKLEDFACCKKCNELLAHTGRSGTTGLIRHNCEKQNSRRKISSKHSKRQLNATPKTLKYPATRHETFDDLDYVQSGTTAEDLFTVPTVYEQSGGDGGGCDGNSKKRSYGEAFDDTSSVQQFSNPDCNDNDYVSGEYVDMEYQIKHEPNQVGDVDNDNDDGAQSPVEFEYCNDDEDSIQHINLMELLKQSIEGQNALNYYDTHNHLNIKHREVIFNTLINIITSSSECQKYNENLRKISYELRQLFPKENYSTWELHKHTMRMDAGETSNQEDPKLYNLLNSWSLQHLYDHFRAENVTFDVVKIMETKHIDRLFKNLTVGDNVLFDHQFTKWIENGSPEPLIDIDLTPRHKVFLTSENRDVYNKHYQHWEQHQTLSSNEEMDIEGHGVKTGIDTNQHHQQPILRKPSTNKFFDEVASGNINMDSSKNKDFTEILRKMSELQMHLIAKIDRLMVEILSLRNDVAFIKAKVCGELNPPREQLPMVQYTTMDEFSNFEDTIKDEAAMEKFVNKLTTINEKTYDKFVRKCWRHLITDDVAKQCCWRGTDNKKCVRDLRITLGIRNAFKQKFNLDDADFDRTTQKFFQYAQDRIKKSEVTDKRQKV